MEAREYIVWFELFGKKMKTSVIASSESEAKKRVQSKIVFYKVEVKPEDRAFSDIMGKFDEIFDMFGKKGKK
jgi:hypothetical protein